MDDFNNSKPDHIFSREPLKKRAAPIWRDLRLLVAVQLYMLGRISSDRAAKLADVPHVEFLLSLGFYKVFPLQSELVELERAAQAAKNKPKEPPTTPTGESKTGQTPPAKPSSFEKPEAETENKPASGTTQQTQEKP